MIVVVGRVERQWRLTDNGEVERVSVLTPVALEASDAERLFPHLEHGGLCERCGSRPATVDSYCAGCDELIASIRADLDELEERG